MGTSPAFREQVPLHHRLDTTSPGNANNNYRALQRWFAFLLNEGEIDRDPMSTMKPPTVPEALVPVIPESSIQAVLKECRGAGFMSRRDTAIIRLFWDTGARLSEITNLTVDDVDLRVDTIRVVGKRRERAVPFSHKTGQALSRCLRAGLATPRPIHPTCGWRNATRADLVAMASA